MSLKAMLWALDAPIDRPTAKLALIAIADHANEDGYCWPSQRLLMARVGCSESTLRRALDDLEKAGFIVRNERRRPDGTRASDSFLLLMEPVEHQPVDLTGSDIINRSKCTGQPVKMTPHEPVIEPPICSLRSPRVRERAREAELGSVEHSPRQPSNDYSLEADAAEAARVAGCGTTNLSKHAANVEQVRRWRDAGVEDPVEAVRQAIGSWKGDPPRTLCALDARVMANRPRAVAPEDDPEIRKLAFQAGVTPAEMAEEIRISAQRRRQESASY